MRWSFAFATTEREDGTVVKANAVLKREGDLNRTARTDLPPSMGAGQDHGVRLCICDVFAVSKTEC